MARSEAALERNRAAARAYQARKKAEDPEAWKAKRHAYYLANRDKAIAVSRASHRRNHLLRRYGLTVEQYDAMVAALGGACPGCGVVDRQLVVDHDHQTGAVRGLLCNPCNIAVGHAQDSVEILMSLAAYLIQTQNVLTPREEMSCPM